jgi:hypothetical protein
MKLGASKMAAATASEMWRYEASFTQRKPSVPARSLLGAIKSSLPC